MTLLAVPLLLYLVLLAALYIRQRSFIYLPDRSRPDASRVGVAGLREASIVTADGLTLLAWYLPPPRPDAMVVVYFHGNGGNIGDRADRVRRFAAAEWGALFPEYRGYGGNPDSPSEAGLLADGRAAMEFLRRQGIPPKRMVIYGESLGTGVAVRMAGEQVQAIAALILESPFTSLTAMARRQFPYVPVALLLKDRFDSIDRIQDVRGPILVAQGGRDDIVPVAQGRALFVAAPEPKEIWLAPDAGHNDLEDFGVVETAIAFAARHAAP
ncbi:MAG TPA: alpha/beta hydrolase [Stellaceae bacterium]|nr:alpha/beta hydrolase [Stellaceae bacterium]